MTSHSWHMSAHAQALSFKMYLILAATYIFVASAYPKCNPGSFGRLPRTFLLVVSAISACYDCHNMFIHVQADPGTFSGSPENMYLLQNIKSLRNASISKAYCESAYIGVLLNQPVAIVSTGIGPLQAASCVQALLSCLGPLNIIKEMIYAGTSAFPAAVGGILNPPLCSGSAANPSTTTTEWGDVCITPFALNWDCQQTNWTAQAGPGASNICYAPKDGYGPTASFLYGKCVYTSAPNSSLVLTKELETASRLAMTTPLPTNDTELIAYYNSYWNQTIRGTGVNYNATWSKDFRVKTHTNCAEIDSQFFWSGPPWEWLTRTFSAETLNIAAGGGAKWTAKDVVYANAMEGIGFLQALEGWNGEVVAPQSMIPYTMIRGHSNYEHLPVAYTGNDTWGYALPIIEYNLMSNSYTYAIQSYSRSLLTMFKSRCLKQGGKTCTFSL